MLYGRQEIRRPSRTLAGRFSEWVCDRSGSVCEQTFGSCRLHSHRNLMPFDSQIAWVLYGQASRAISMG